MRYFGKIFARAAFFSHQHYEKTLKFGALQRPFVSEYFTLVTALARLGTL